MVGRLRGGFEPGLDALPNLGTIALLWLGAWRVSSGAITTGELVQAMALFGILAFPFRIVGFLLEELPRAVVANDRVNGVLAAPVRPRPAAVTALPDRPARRRPRRRQLRLRRRRGARPTCRPGSLPGRWSRSSAPPAPARPPCAASSPTCSTPRSGEIRLGGVPLPTADPDALHRSTALVFQETFLFADTVRENLAMGEAVDDERDLGGARDREGTGLRRAPAPRARRGDRRAGGHPLGRPAPADRPRPRPPPAAPPAPARRCHLRRRRHGRAGDPRRPARRRSPPPRSSSPTACPPSPSPTACCCSTEGGSRPRAPTARCCSVPAYAALVRAYEQDAA